MRVLAALALATAAIAIGAPPGAQARPYVGVYVDEVLDQDPAAQQATFDAIHQAGFGFVRIPFEWARMETAPGRWDFARYDSLVLAAARAHLRVLPVLYAPPPWAVAAPPAPGQLGMPHPDPGLFADYALRLVRRYGPGAALWSAHPELAAAAVGGWQIWNEPNHPFWWPGGPDAKAYARLLGAAAAAIRGADPAAVIVAAGIPESTGGSMWDFVRDLYLAGARSSFDVLAIHAYAPTAQGAFGLVRATRREMMSFGDAAKPMWITEAGWASGGPASDFTRDEPGQALADESLLGLLFDTGDSLGVQALTLFQWQDAVPPSGQRDLWPYHAGLLRADGTAKPVLAGISAMMRRPAGHAVARTPAAKRHASTRRSRCRAVSRRRRLPPSRRAVRRPRLCRAHGSGARSPAARAPRARSGTPRSTRAATPRRPSRSG